MILPVIAITFALVGIVGIVSIAAFVLGESVLRFNNRTLDILLAIFIVSMLCGIAVTLIGVAIYITTGVWA